MTFNTIGIFCETNVKLETSQTEGIYMEERHVNFGVFYSHFKMFHLLDQLGILRKNIWCLWLNCMIIVAEAHPLYSYYFYNVVVNVISINNYIINYIKLYINYSSTKEICNWHKEILLFP